MEKKKETVTKEAKDMSKEKTNVVKMNKQKAEVKFVDVNVQAFGEHKGKKYVPLKEIRFNSENGNIFAHLDEKHTLMLKSTFLGNDLKINVQLASEVEKSITKAPSIEGKEPVDSKVRLKVLGEGEDGKVFVTPTGAVTYDPLCKGFQIKLDSQHVSVIDGPTLNRRLGIKLMPQILEKSRQLGR